MVSLLAWSKNRMGGVIVSLLAWSKNRMGGVMVSLLALSAIYHGFEPQSCQTKDYGICCFPAKHAALRRKNKDWLARNQDSVSEWSDMSIQ